MKRVILFLHLFLFFNFSSANMSNQQLIGQWKIEIWITGALDTNISQEDVDNIIGKILIIDAQKITLKAPVLDPDERTCLIDDTDSGWITSDPVSYFNNDYDWPVNARDIKILSLQRPFWALNSCIPVFTTENPDQIVFIFGSTFFKAKRIVNS